MLPEISPWLNHTGRKAPTTCFQKYRPRSTTVQTIFKSYVFDWRGATRALTFFTRFLPLHAKFPVNCQPMKAQIDSCVQHGSAQTKFWGWGCICFCLWQAHFKYTRAENTNRRSFHLQWFQSKSLLSECIDLYACFVLPLEIFSPKQKDPKHHLKSKIDVGIKEFVWL